MEPIKKGRDSKTTDEQYDEILRKIYDLRIASDKLSGPIIKDSRESCLHGKYIFIQRAEMRYRELLKGVQRESGR